MNLQVAARAEKALDQGSMELLSMSRIRISQVDRAGTAQKMKIIDRITFDLYQTIEIFDEIITCAQYDTPGGDIDCVVKILL